MRENQAQKEKEILILNKLSKYKVKKNLKKTKFELEVNSFY